MICKYINANSGKTDISFDVTPKSYGPWANSARAMPMCTLP